MPGVVAHGAAAKVGLDRARRHHVDRDPARAELLGHVPAENFHPSLHRPIGGFAREAKARQPGGNIHDASPIGDQRQQLLRQEENAFEVDVHELIELLLRGLGETRVHAGAGVVDQIREAVPFERVLQSLAQIGCKAIEGLAVGGVQRQRRGGAPRQADRVHDLLGFRALAEIRDDHVAALFGQLQRRAATETAAAAGDQGKGGTGGHGNLRDDIRQNCIFV